MADETIKHMSVKEFRDLGLLMEINRLFLHPLGLALEAVVEENGDMRLGGIQDFRDDPEGMAFAEDSWFPDDIVRAEYVEAMHQQKLPARQKLFNNEDGIQPIPKEEPR